MRKKNLVIVEDRAARAAFCTEYLETFESSCRNWVDLAMILVEVERDELFLEMGYSSFDDWAQVKAPVSHRLCFAIKGRYKALKEAKVPDSSLRLMPPETADWASKARNISPVELAKPEVLEALKLPKQKAVKVLKQALPAQHIEEEFKLNCKFAESQGKYVLEGYEAFKRLKDEKGSLSDFVEFVVSEWMESVFAVRGDQSVTVRQCWEQFRPQ